MRISDWSSDVCSSDLLLHLCRGASAGALLQPLCPQERHHARAGRADRGQPAPQRRAQSEGDLQDSDHPRRLSSLTHHRAPAPPVRLPRSDRLRRVHPTVPNVLPPSPPEPAPPHPLTPVTPPPPPYPHP